MAEVRTKMVRLAKRVKVDVSSYEELRLEIAAKDVGRPTRESIKKSIAGVLGESVDRVQTRLAEHSDSDRILDEIIMHLDSASGDD